MRSDEPMPSNSEGFLLHLIVSLQGEVVALTSEGGRLEGVLVEQRAPWEPRESEARRMKVNS